MSDQSGEIRVEFRNLLFSAYPLIKSKPFVNIDSGELSYYARYMQYRVQRDLYEICEEVPGTLSWERLVLMMRCSKELRDKSINAIRKKMETALYDFNFTQKKITFFDESDGPEDRLYAAMLISDAEGTFLMSLLLYFAQQAHFNHLQDTVRPNYKWEEYFSDLQRDGELWHEVLTAFRDAVQRLDFKLEWLGAWE